LTVTGCVCGATAGARSSGTTVKVSSGAFMSAVVVGWTGRCPDGKDREKLLAHLQRLAEISDCYLRRHPTSRTSTTSPTADLRSKREQARANVEYVDSQISDRVVISSGIVPERHVFLAAAHEASLPTHDHPERDGAAIAVLAEARLTGIDFRLYDPLQSGAGRLSFVFLDTAAAPFLNGRLVQAERGRDHESETIRNAAFYLDGPSVSLHSHLGDWIDLLLSWVKYFFIGDLWWRRLEDMQGYEDYRQVFADVQRSLGPERAEQATFDAILATFSQHAEHWTGKVAVAGS
jgi:hypothetical protein